MKPRLISLAGLLAVLMFCGAVGLALVAPRELGGARLWVSVALMACGSVVCALAWLTGTLWWIGTRQVAAGTLMRAGRARQAAAPRCAECGTAPAVLRCTIHQLSLCLSCAVGHDDLRACSLHVHPYSTGAAEVADAR